jgi:hypothetical protein
VLARSGLLQTGLARLQAWQPRSWQTWFSIALIAPAVLLFIGDRAAAAFTGDQIRDRVAAELSAQDVSYGSLTVDVADWPFLTQAVSRNLNEITISMTDLNASTDTTTTEAAITIASVNVVATAVRFTVGDLVRGDPTATAEQVVGSAVISYPALDSLVDLSGMSLADVRFSESEGALRFDALGALAPVQASADVIVENGRLRVKLRDAQFASLDLPPLSRELLDQILALTIDILMPPLPLGLTLESVTPEPDGLSISVVGHDVPLTVDS